MRLQLSGPNDVAVELPELLDGGEPADLPQVLVEVVRLLGARLPAVPHAVRRLEAVVAERNWHQRLGRRRTRRQLLVREKTL